MKIYTSSLRSDVGLTWFTKLDITLLHLLTKEPWLKENNHAAKMFEST